MGELQREVDLDCLRAIFLMEVFIMVSHQGRWCKVRGSGGGGGGG
jgi:hypothetical protein